MKGVITRRGTLAATTAGMADAIIRCWEGYDKIDYRKWAKERHDVAETVRQAVEIYKRYV